MRLTTIASFAVGCQYFANVVLCTTLKPNGFNNSEKKSNTLNASVFTVVWLFKLILCSTLRSLQVKKNNWKCDSKEVDNSMHVFKKEMVLF